MPSWNAETIASSTHVMNFLTMVYLQRCAERRGCENHAAEHVLAMLMMFCLWEKQVLGRTVFAKVEGAVQR